MPHPEGKFVFLRGIGIGTRRQQAAGVLATPGDRPPMDLDSRPGKHDKGASAQWRQSNGPEG